MVNEIRRKAKRETSYDERATRFGDRAADAVASFGGSWKFIFIFAVALTSWVTLNSLRMFDPIAWDKPPFILLNLCLSFIAAFQAPFIMMSQNRQSVIDRKRAVRDLEIDELAEQEIEDIQGHLHRVEENQELIMAHLGIVKG